MKLQYVEDTITIERLQALTSRRILRLTVGWIEIGTETVTDESDESKLMQVPITRKGVEIEFEGDVSNADLHKIDSYLAKNKLSRKAL